MKYAIFSVLTISKRSLTSFSDSPLYLDVKVEEDTLKKVVPHSVATAFANIVFPVPAKMNYPLKYQQNYSLGGISSD